MLGHRLEAVLLVVFLVFCISSQGFVPASDAQMATKSTTSIGFVQIDKSEYDVSYTSTATVKVNGTVLSPNSGDSKITILFKLPDGSTKGSEVSMLPNGYFETSLGLDSNSQKGTYSVLVSYANNMIGSVYFSVKQVSAKSILNDIANQTVKSTSNVQPPSIPSVSPTITPPPTSQPSSTIDVTKPSKIPSWVKKIFVLYGQGQVSEDELLNAVQYLAQNKLIQITVTQSDVPQTTSPPVQNNAPVQSSTTQTTNPNPAVSVSSTNNAIDNFNFASIYANPNNYKNNWTVFVGKVSHLQDDQNVIQFDIDPSGFDLTHQVFVELAHGSVSQYPIGTCLKVEGHIIGSDQYQYKSGDSTSNLQMTGEKISQISCLDATYPAMKTITMNTSQTIGDVQITIQKVEFAKEHTRVFATIHNLSTSREVYFHTYDSYLVQGQSQYTRIIVYGTDQKDLDTTILPGIVESGYLFYDPAPQNSFKLLLEADEQTFYNDYTANYPIDYFDHKFTFDIPAQ